MTKKVERPYLQLGRPRKYSKEEAKQKYALKQKQRVENLTDEEKELRKFKKKEYAKKNKEKINARRKVRKLDPEYRKKLKEAQKRSEKRAKKKNPFVMIGENLKDSARNRNIEAPHKPLEYRKWYEKKTKVCYYCGNNNETIKSYLKKIGEKVGNQQNRLHIERIDNSKGYLIDNLTLACSICNTHKSDIISAEDFKKIAQKYIAPKIKNKLDFIGQPTHSL
jgi:hypothetical protein